MGLFSGPEEQERKAKLKRFEDKRLAFAQQLDKRGFKPEKMLFAQAGNGGFISVCNFEGKQWLIISPGFGAEDEDYVLESYDHFDVRRQEVHVKSQGMGGILGFGKKGEHGAEYVITRADGSEIAMPFVFGRSSWAEFPLKKNPLLLTRRRRKDANVVWDLHPVDNAQLNKITELADKYFGI